MSINSSKNKTSPQVFSLSELSRKIKSSLNDSFPEKVWLRGEISDIRQHSNGHVYIELIEKAKNSDKITARIKATIWSFTYRMLRPYFEGTTGYALSTGIKIMVLASVEYHPQYSISLNITDIDPSYTLGDLAQKKDEILQRLVQEGVIDMNKELEIPIVPQRIAVISSESAAGYEDFLNSLENNIYNFHFNITLFPALMQGDKAVESIINMLENIYENEEKYDLVVIIRGGGAKIDLECFNDYELAYHITQFPLPVLTGIGHERDETITDIAAHTKLKTPTAVAEFLIDSLLVFLSELNEFRDRITNISNNRFQDSENLINRYSLLLFNVTKNKLSDHHNKLSRLGIQAESKSRKLLFHKAAELNSAKQQIRSRINSKIREAFDKFETSSRLIRVKSPKIINLENQKLISFHKALKILDPINILKRGYSLSYFKGMLIKESGKLKSGDEIQTRLYKGQIISRVTKNK
ncbi:MAG: exodeoxyribonuclease VII large subunit [Bacteroidales bacterium]|nr:exodeoxyribonuclease VII large subunit [Bacteroidales bacterium]